MLGHLLAYETGIELITGGAVGVGAAALTHHDLWVAASFGLIVLALAG